MLFAQRRSSSSLSLGLHRPHRVESPRPARLSDRVDPVAGTSNRSRPAMSSAGMSSAATGSSVQVVLTSRGARAVPVRSVACDVSPVAVLRRPPSRLGGAPCAIPGAIPCATPGAIPLAAVPATVGAANGSHHAIELVGACMMIAVFLVLALFA